ncbi:hypothetical protein M422DRAFT_33023 [Sphaerobolus stellatus SS14]|uniref:NTF2 domain-containing protein n=1 Tax=Sphaerobolus stellatus (strain SS14) TaxID=990650 RepID=A0A0C9U7M9_SPHS4|nr:hypothetical protein M422DRAFT_33023 [Sphaerobolus stellatus SS14]
MTAPASSSTSTSTPSAIHANVIPSEVGWQFVPQYYTFVNKQPHRLHCFYTKNSTFIHGTEGEDGRPCYGQQEIHNKILSIGFQDCKVFIHSVDAQASANGGIIIQVIGEMSNRGEPWRKFAQTFFLAEQPNGYFVLNDIFRFLKEESVDTEEDEAEQAETPEATATTTEIAQQTLEPAAPAVQAAHPVVAAQPFEAALPNHLQAKAVPEVPAQQPEPVVIEEKKAAPNGIHEAAPPAQEAAPIPQAEPIKDAAPEPAPVEAPRPVTPQQAPQAPAPEPAAPAPAPPAPAAAPVPPAPKPASPAPSPAPPAAPAAAAAPPKPAAPPQPKTWANLAAANSNKWGSQVAQEARGVTAAPAPAPAPAPAAPKPEVHRSEKEQHPLLQAALAVSTPQCFVKNVTEVVSHEALRNVLASRFGPIKDIEIVRSKACAFLEFGTLDSARKAIIASLPQPAGGEGGIRIDVEGGGSIRVNVETRKERGDRPQTRRQGGPGQGQDGRGGAQGGFRGGAQRGRGAGRGQGKP